MLVGEYLTGRQQTIERITGIHVATMVEHRILARRTIADEIAHHQDIVGLQRVDNQSVDEFLITR